MKSIFSRKSKVSYIFIFISLSVVTLSIFASQSISLVDRPNQDIRININQEDFTQEWFKESHETELIVNGDFDDNFGWVSDFNGDISDVDTTIVNGGGNFKVIGETYTTTLISGIINSPYIKTAYVL